VSLNLSVPVSDFFAFCAALRCYYVKRVTTDGGSSGNDASPKTGGKRKAPAASKQTHTVDVGPCVSVPI
jgi:hypothetical protein